jgi:hypothetical protein
VLASFGAEHGHGTEGRDGGRRWLLTERKRENCEGSDVGGATQRKEEGRGPGSVAPRRGGRREGGLAVGKAHGRQRRWPVGRLPREQGSERGSAEEGGSWAGPDRTMLISI